VGYYMGDFYQGDPGFGSFLGGLAKRAVGFIPGVGPIARNVIDVVGKVGGRVARSRVGGAIIKHPVLSAAGAAGTVGAIAGGMGGRMGGATGSSQRSRSMRGVGGGFGRRHRRMRVTNPKALRRAIRRTAGFAKLAMKTIHLIHPRKKVRFGGFRMKRKK
jgi:hypothetical protein